LVIDFGRRTTAGLYVSQTEERLEAEIDTLLERQQVLKQRRDYVQTDAYVERWAREQAHMVRPGDRRLIVVTPEPSEAQPESQPAAPPPLESITVHEPAPNWHNWWRLFWDTEPGSLWKR
jgi:hypothetical protein